MKSKNMVKKVEEKSLSCLWGRKCLLMRKKCDLLIGGKRVPYLQA